MYLQENPVDGNLHIGESNVDNETLNRSTLKVIVDERVGGGDRALRSHYGLALLSRTIRIEGSAGTTGNAASSRSRDVRVHLTETRYGRYFSVIIEPFSGVGAEDSDVDNSAPRPTRDIQVSREITSSGRSS